jgi:RNA polymerase sigma factor (sigma-70 family)
MDTLTLNEAAAPDDSDEQLAKARLGERAALAALVRAHQRSVYSLALRMLGTRDQAEDLTQDVFMQLSANVKSIESGSHLLFWLRRVTTNRAIDQLRRRSRLEMTPWDDDTPLVALLAPALAWAAPNPRLVLPDLTALAHKATESVTISLDPSLLAMAGRFLNADDPQDAATKEILKGLQGIYVRSYTFDQDSAYRQADIDAIRNQLSAPGWNRLVETRSRKTQADVDIYIMVENNQAIGLALIASEPRQITIVNIVGSIDLDKLHKLEGQFGVPKLDVDMPKAPTPNPKK